MAGDQGSALRTPTWFNPSSDPACGGGTHAGASSVTYTRVTASDSERGSLSAENIINFERMEGTERRRIKAGEECLGCGRRMNLGRKEMWGDLMSQGPIACTDFARGESERGSGIRKEKRLWVFPASDGHLPPGSFARFLRIARRLLLLSSSRRCAHYPIRSKLSFRSFSQHYVPPRLLRL